MSAAKPPAGYVGLDVAEEITGYSSQTIVLAAKTGELKALQRVKGSRWFFKPDDLREWCGIEASVAS